MIQAPKHLYQMLTNAAALTYVGIATTSEPARIRFDAKVNRVFTVLYPRGNTQPSIAVLDGLHTASLPQLA
jgi:hypothetical protein